MSNFEIAIKTVSGCGKSLENCTKELSRISREIEQISSVLAIYDQSAEVLKAKLNRISEDVRVESEISKASTDALFRIVQLYRDADKVPGADESLKTSGKKQKANQAKPSDSGFSWTDMAYKTAIAAAGPAGLVIDGFVQGADSEWGKVIGDASKLVSGYAKNHTGSKIQWGEWFGLSPLTKTPSEYALGKYFDFSDGKAAFSSGCSWIAQLAGSGFENYQEFDGSLESRFFEETIVETLLKVGESVAINAGVATAAVAVTTALGLAAPPVIVVGAAAAAVTVGVDWALNAITQNVSNKDKWYDAVGDWIIDKTHEVEDAKKDIRNHIWNGLKNGWENLTGGRSNRAGAAVSW